MMSLTRYENFDGSEHLQAFHTLRRRNVPPPLFPGYLPPLGCFLAVVLDRLLPPQACTLRAPPPSQYPPAPAAPPRSLPILLSLPSPPSCVFPVSSSCVSSA